MIKLFIDKESLSIKFSPKSQIRSLLIKSYFKRDIEEVLKDINFNLDELMYSNIDMILYLNTTNEFN